MMQATTRVINRAWLSSENIELNYVCGYNLSGIGNKNIKRLNGLGV